MYLTRREFGKIISRIGNEGVAILEVPVTFLEESLNIREYLESCGIHFEMGRIRVSVRFIWKSRTTIYNNPREFRSIVDLSQFYRIRTEEAYQHPVDTGRYVVPFLGHFDFPIENIPNSNPFPSSNSFIYIIQQYLPLSANISSRAQPRYSQSHNAGFWH